MDIACLTKIEDTVDGVLRVCQDMDLTFRPALFNVMDTVAEVLYKILKKLGFISSIFLH